MGEIGGAASDHPDPGALLRAGLDRLDPGLVDREAEARAALGEDLGELAPRGEGPREHAFGDVLVDQLAHGRPFPATSIKRPAATKSSLPSAESDAWSAARPPA